MKSPQQKAVACGVNRMPQEHGAKRQPQRCNALRAPPTEDARCEIKIAARHSLESLNLKKEAAAEPDGGLADEVQHAPLRKVRTSSNDLPRIAYDNAT